MKKARYFNNFLVKVDNLNGLLYNNYDVKKCGGKAMWGERYVILIKFKDGDEGYYCSMKDGHIYFNRDPHRAKIYDSCFKVGWECADIETSFRNIVSSTKMKTLK